MLSISQLCDSACSIVFNKDECIVKNKDENKIFVANRQINFYEINMYEL